MMPGTVGAAAPVAGGMGQVLSRVEAIQARIGTFAPPPAAAFEAALAQVGGGLEADNDQRATPVRRSASLGDAAAATAANLSAAGTATESADWASRLPERGQRWAGAIQQAADDAGIDPRLLASLVQHESNFDPEARSHAGAIGLAQLMPGTAAGLGVDPHDPHENLAGGARYLRSQLDRFGSPELALAAYNAGPNRVAQAGGIPQIAETQAYVPRVMNTYRELA